MVSVNPEHFRSRIWKLAHNRELELGPRAIIMGILNITPDSFSDGNRYGSTDLAVTEAIAMAEAGAEIIDVGGESTRPGADAVSAQTEQDRVLPVIEELTKETDSLISIDTYRADTARCAIEAGAHIINDVWGFQKDREIASVAAALKAGCCLMHTGRERARGSDVFEDQERFVSASIEIATKNGVATDAIVLDPGFGFAKNNQENVQLLAGICRLNLLGYPLVVGTSRKRFIGGLTGHDVAKDRDVGTAATSAIARLQGGAIFRVHDVAKNRDALAISDAVINAQIAENIS